MRGGTPACIRWAKSGGGTGSVARREQLGSLLLGALPVDFARYVAFHVEVVGCRYCQANLADLRTQQQAEAEQAAQVRRRAYLKSSAGYLRGKKTGGSGEQRFTDSP